MSGEPRGRAIRRIRTRLAVRAAPTPPMSTRSRSCEGQAASGFYAGRSMVTLTRSLPRCNSQIQRLPYRLPSPLHACSRGSQGRGSGWRSRPRQPGFSVSSVLALARGVGLCHYGPHGPIIEVKDSRSIGGSAETGCGNTEARSRADSPSAVGSVGRPEECMAGTPDMARPPVAVVVPTRRVGAALIPFAAPRLARLSEP